MRLVIPGWIKALAALGLLVAAVYALRGLGQEHYRQGQQAERLMWTGKENAALRSAHARLRELEEKARAAEARHAQTMAAISTQYQKDLSNERLAKDRALAAVRRGELRLYDPAGRAVSVGGVQRGDACPAGPRAAGGDDAAPGELSTPAAEFLLALTGEADEVTHQLTACQAVIAADHQVKEQP
ncbi:lysis protein [Herbaspirillum sp. DW155]|uniref:lysis system i-spanin subunit Rz n=1 Tax=Herbaspirillum sp. DW155 TaxID=3095609 RepID=UPI00308CAC83|nr:lysis protein [Herbaspirillum sp. DW155]